MKAVNEGGLQAFCGKQLRKLGEGGIVWKDCWNDDYSNYRRTSGLGGLAAVRSEDFKNIRCLKFYEGRKLISKEYR